MTERDINAFALMMLSLLRDTPEFGATASLAYILNREDFDNLIDMFGGQTFRVPTRDEVRRALGAIMYYHYREVQHRNKVTALRESGLSIEDLPYIESHLDQIKYMVKHFEAQDDEDD